MKATSHLPCLCVVPGWGISGGAEGRGPHVFLVPGLSVLPCLVPSQAALPAAKGSVSLPSVTAGHNSNMGSPHSGGFQECPMAVAALNWLSWQVRPFARWEGAALALPGGTHTAGSKASRGAAGLGWAPVRALSLSSCFLYCLPGAEVPSSPGSPFPSWSLLLSQAAAPK